MADSKSTAEVARDLERLRETLPFETRDATEGLHVSERFLERVPISYARRHGVLGFLDEEGRERLGSPGAVDLAILDVLSRRLEVPLIPILLPREILALRTNEAYEARSTETNELLETLDRDRVLEELEEAARSPSDLLDSASQAPVIQLVNLLLFEAVRAKASDIHFQPGEERIAVRMRIDGVLFDLFEVPKALQDEVTSRVKIIGRMDIAEKRLAQDGRATVTVGERTIDLRLSAVPTSFGERLVIRLLDKRGGLFSLAELGMDARTHARFQDSIRAEHGLILVTGPTGSGKSTTLYAVLGEINSEERNVITLEDPIEYQLRGVSQIQVSGKKGMTFASGLRSVLRQDPDIIMVGEIRDHETAVMAIQSALTGHLVLSTLHTNDAPSAVTRLLDLGIEPYLVSSSLICVMAQRLVRRICESCCQEADVAQELLARLGINAEDQARLRRGTGCVACRGTGYSGRTGLFELLEISADVEALVGKRASAGEIREVALREGLKTLREDGQERVLSGQTTIDEVLRVTQRKTS